MSRSAESATPILFSSWSSCALARQRLLQLPDHPPVVEGVEGPVEAEAQAAGGHGLDEQVVQEGEPAEEVVALLRLGHRHQQRPGGPAAAQPLLDRLGVGFDDAGIGQEEAAAAVGVGARLIERSHLRHGQSRRQFARDQVPDPSPHQDVGHDRWQRLAQRRGSQLPRSALLGRAGGRSRARFVAAGREGPAGRRSARRAGKTPHRADRGRRSPRRSAPPPPVPSPRPRESRRPWRSRPLARPAPPSSGRGPADRVSARARRRLPRCARTGGRLPYPRGAPRERSPGLLVRTARVRPASASMASSTPG